MTKGRVEHDRWDVLFDIERTFQGHAAEGRPAYALASITVDGTDTEEYLIQAAAVIVAWILDKREASRNAAHEGLPSAERQRTN